MGWKAFLRAAEQSARRADRARMARHRELVREHARLEKHLAAQQRAYDKAAAKAAAIAAAKAEVEEFESYLDLLISLHKEAGPIWNWADHQRASPPPKPEPMTARQGQAEAALAAFQPSFLDKLLFRTNAKRAALDKALARAQHLDAEDDANAAKSYRSAYQTWEQRRQVAEGVLKGDVAAFKRALMVAAAYDDLKEFKVSVTVEPHPDVIVLSCTLQDDELVPTEELKLTAAGKVSTKEMPAARRWTLRQDFVCSSALRAALETFVVLPQILRVIVNVKESRLDSSTGKHVQPTILALHITRSALRGINLDAIDPSDSIKNFNARMKFKKTTGFEPVEPITVDEQWVST